MTRDEARKLSEQNNPTNKSIRFAYSEIELACKKGLYSTRCNCPTEIFPRVKNKLEEDLFRVIHIYDERGDHRTIYEIRWEEVD